MQLRLRPDFAGYRREAFYIAFGLHYLNGIIGQTTMAEIPFISSVMTGVRWIVLILLLLVLLGQNYTVRSAWIVVLSGCAFLLSYLLCDYQELAWGFLFVAAAKDADLRRAAKEILIITVAAVAAIMLLADFGLIESITEDASGGRSYLWSGGDTIPLWGFTHHNYLGCRTLTFYLCYVILRYDRFALIDLAPAWACFCFCYYLIKSRTAAILIVVATVLVLIYRLLPWLKVKIGAEKTGTLAQLGTGFIMLFSVFFSLLVCVGYTSRSDLFEFLDDLLSTRVSRAHNMLGDYGYSLFGQQVELLGTQAASEAGVASVILDNSYMHLFIRCGVLVGVLVLTAYFIAARKAIRRENYSVAVVISTYFVCGISECWLFTITYNPLLILLSPALYGENGKSGEESVPDLVASAWNWITGKRKEKTGQRKLQGKR